MYTITKGYKQGRGVLFYDLTDAMEGTVREMVTKDEVVKMTEDGQITNAKIQWWEGKPIVRCSDKKLPLVKVDEAGAIVGVAHQAVRNSSAVVTCSVKHEKEEHVVDVSDKAVIVGKLSTRRPKTSTTYPGYDKREVFEHQELNKTVSYTGMTTLEDLFNAVATEFNLLHKDLYRSEIAKKVKLERQIAGINRSELLSIQRSFAMYLVNMAYEEINKTYMKYNVAC